jgi:hypothetical protein
LSLKNLVLLSLFIPQVFPSHEFANFKELLIVRNSPDNLVRIKVSCLMVFQTGPAERELISALMIQYHLKSHLINVD